MLSFLPFEPTQQLHCLWQRSMLYGPAYAQLSLFSNRAQVTSATNSVTGGSFPSTPQKPDDIVNDGLDDVKATIAEAQASGRPAPVGHRPALTVPVAALAVVTNSTASVWTGFAAVLRHTCGILLGALSSL